MFYFSYFLRAAGNDPKLLKSFFYSLLSTPCLHCFMSAYHFDCCFYLVNFAELKYFLRSFDSENLLILLGVIQLFGWLLGRSSICLVWFSDRGAVPTSELGLLTFCRCGCLELILEVKGKRLGSTHPKSEDSLSILWSISFSSPYELCFQFSRSTA